MKHVLPYHSCIAEKIVFHKNRPVLIPELWVTGNSYEKIVNGFINKGFIKTSDAKPWEPMLDIIVTNEAFFDRLKSTDLISCTIFSGEEYFNDVRTFFQMGYAVVNNLNLESFFYIDGSVDAIEFDLPDSRLDLVLNVGISDKYSKCIRFLSNFFHSLLYRKIRMSFKGVSIIDCYYEDGTIINEDCKNVRIEDNNFIKDVEFFDFLHGDKKFFYLCLEDSEFIFSYQLVEIREI